MLIQPIMPGAAERLWDQLGQSASRSATSVCRTRSAWGRARRGTVTTKGESLFPRVDA